MRIFTGKVASPTALAMGRSERMGGCEVRFCFSGVRKRGKRGRKKEERERKELRKRKKKRERKAS